VINTEKSGPDLELGKKYYFVIYTEKSGPDLELKKNIIS
jgi:hypothetical protein